MLLLRRYFFIFLVVSVLTATSILANSIGGRWSVPELTPPPRSFAVMQCFTTFEEDPFANAGTSSTSNASGSGATPAPPPASASSSLQLFGGKIEGGETVKTTYTWFDDEGQWFSQKNSLPIARAGFGVVFDNIADIWKTQADTTYMFGGTEIGTSLADNVIYRSQRGAAWRKTLQKAKTKRDAPPVARFAYWVGYMANSDSSSPAIATHGALFIWGGLGSGGVNPSLYWFAFDDQSAKGLRWGEGYKVAAGGPTARYDHCCSAIPAASGVVVQTAICFGGAGLERDYNDVWVVDWSSCDQFAVDATPWSACATWSLLHDGNLTVAAAAGNDFPPTPRRSPACAYVSGENALYVFGGFDVESGKATNDTALYRFDYASYTWAKNPQPNATSVGSETSDDAVLLTPRYGASMASCRSGVNETVYLFGGITEDGAPSGQTFRLRLGANSLAFPDHTNAPLNFSSVGFSALTRPVGRAEHVAVLSQGELYVMFGRSKLAPTSALGDVWKYNVSSHLWVEIKLVTDEENLLASDIPRTGAAAIEFRSGILIFGGQDINAIASNDLLVLQPLNGEIRRIEPASSHIPAPRSYHLMVRLLDAVIVGTGWSAEAGYLDDWWKFDTVNQVWSQLAVVGDAIGARLAMAGLERFNATHSIVGGGIGSRVFADWFWITLDGQGSNTLRATKITFDYSSLSSSERSVIRAYSSLAGSGNHLVLCGGAISETDPAPEATHCYQLDVARRNISSFPTPYLTSVYGTATMVENKIVLFGGQHTSDTSFADKFIDSAQVFTVAQTCPQTATDDSGCIKCSKGFKNVGTSASDARCTVAPQGTYITDGLGAFTACPAGKFSRAVGAFSEDSCLPCPIGTFNPSPGANNCTPCNSSSVCLAGATEQVAASSLKGKFLVDALSRSGRIVEQNPVPYEAPDIPWFPILFVGVTALTLTAVVSIVLVVSHWVWVKRRDYYVPAHVEASLRVIYDEFARSVRGMSEREFIEATFSENFPEHEGTLLEMQRLFKELNVNGIGALSYFDFVEAFVLMISRGHMQPLEGSERREQQKEFEHWAAPLIGRWDVRRFDSFADNHMTATVGKKILSQQISYGGAVTLFFYVAAIIVVLAIVINFLYNNTTETKASVPRAVIQSSFGSLFQVESDIVVSVSVIGPVRSMEGISSLADACVANSALHTCRSTASVTLTNVNFVKPNSLQPLRCVYDQQTGCTISWTCNNCYISEGSTGSLLVRIAPQIAATTIDVDVSASTGIRDPVMEFTGKLSMVGGPNQRSRVVSRAVPSVSTEVLTGFPASVVSFGLTPSYYEADEVRNAVDSAAATYKATGYHVRQSNAPVGGNTVPTELFSQYYDAPVQVNLKVDEVPLLVRRKFTQTVVQLITSLLGAIAGVSGGLLAAVQFLDTKSGINDNSDEVKHEQLESEDEVAGLLDTFSHIERLMTSEEFAVVRPLIERGVEPVQATAFLEILRRRRNNDGRGNAVRVAGRQKSMVYIVNTNSNGNNNNNNNNNSMDQEMTTMMKYQVQPQQPNVNINFFSPRAESAESTGEEEQQVQEQPTVNNNNNNNITTSGGGDPTDAV